MYLLDTNVLSELRRPTRADVRVATWFDSVPEWDQYLSAITIMEIEIGVLRVQRRDPAQGTALRAWLHQQLLPGFDGRILPVDLAVALHGAPMHVPNPCPDRDGLIAATALTHGLTVVTRNVRDFVPMGVAVLNPWEWAD